MLTDEQKKFATWAFDSLDSRRTGCIQYNKDTILEAVRLSGLNPSSIDIDQLINGQDFGNTITKDEFLQLISNMEWKSQDETKQILMGDFDVFTTRHPGTISTEELVYVLTREGCERLTVEEANIVVDKFDKDQKGHIIIDGLIETLLAVTPI